MMSAVKPPMPLFVIDVCSRTDDDHPDDSNKSPRLLRSVSLLDYTEAYKDLSGTIHHPKHILFRSHSCPNNYFSTEEFQSRSTTTIHLLNPNDITPSPSGSSSRYSLYGSFFDLSENSYQSTSIKTKNRFLAMENPSRLSINTYEEKCYDWLNHLNLS